MTIPPLTLSFVILIVLSPTSIAYYTSHGYFCAKRRGKLGNFLQPARCDEQFLYWTLTDRKICLTTSERPYPESDSITTPTWATVPGKPLETNAIDVFEISAPEFIRKIYGVIYFLVRAPKINRLVYNGVLARRPEKGGTATWGESGTTSRTTAGVGTPAGRGS